MTSLVACPSIEASVARDSTLRAAVDGVRVCMVSFYFHPDYSGSSIQALNLSRELVSYGVQPIIVCGNLSNRPRRERYENILVHRLPVARRRNVQIPSFWVSLAAFLVRHRREFDIVHAHGTLQHGTAALCGRLFGKPSILKIAMAGSDIAFNRQGRIWGGLNRFMVEKFDHYVATTDVIAQEIASELDGTRTIRIPNGVDTAKHLPLEADAQVNLRAQLGLPQGPLVTFVGIINGRKNIDGILRIWERAVRHGSPGHLVLVGPVPDDTPSARQYRSQLDEYITAHNLADRVTFTGYRHDAVRYLQAADVFLFPSRQEGMPNVVLEAMASGLPVVAANVGGVADFVESPDGGALVAKGDAAAMGAEILDLVNDEQRRRRAGAFNRQRATTKFSWRTSAEQLLAAYERAMARRAA